MSTAPENPTALPLEELQIAPAWVKTQAASYEGHTGQDRERGRRRDRDFDRESRPPRAKSAAGKRPGPPRRDDRRRERPVGPRPAGRPAPPPPLPIEVAFYADEKTLTAMVDTIRQSGRAYAFFDIAKLVLNKPERHLVTLISKAGPLFRTLPVENVFLTQDAALHFLLRQHPEKIFKETRRPTEPPKGSFQFVNRCGLTGEWLGPPNFHEYQARLVRHHQQRLRHVPFEDFKARIETVRDPEAVKAWVESKSSIAEYECLLDTPPQIFTSRDELEKHVRDAHLAALVTGVKQLRLSGPVARQIADHRILEALREAWESERRFPLRTANQMRARLMREGLHFFKAGEGVTYVSKTKLNQFDSIQHLTEHVQKIITFLRAHEGCARKTLVEQLAPADENLLWADLHWLIQDGYVVEFFDGRLWALADRTPKSVSPVAEASASAEAHASATDQPK